MISANAEPPSFAVTAPSDHAASGFGLPAEGEGLWAEMPCLRIWGDWPSHKLRTVTTELSRVAIFGDCFAENSTLQAVAERAASEQRPELLSSLPGSHVAVIADPTHNHVTVLSSLSGQPTVYYGERNGSTVIASRPSLVSNERLIPDLRYVAAQLITPNPEGALFRDNSSYEGVRKLLGGQMLRTTVYGSKVDTYETFAPDLDTSIDEAAERLREALKHAVASRLHVGLNVSSDLSGGLDSSSLAFLATQSMRGAPLRVFTSYHPGIDEGDMSYALRFTKNNPLMKLHTFTNSEVTGAFSYNDFIQTPWDEDFGFSKIATPDVWKFIRAYYSFIAENLGGPIHLTGDGGDEIVGVNATYLADLLTSRQYGRFLSEGMDWARLNNMSALGLWKGMVQLAYRDPAMVLREAAEEIRSPRSRGNLNWLEQVLPWRPIGPGLGWLTEEARRDLFAYYSEAANSFTLPQGMGIGDYLAVKSMRCAGQAANMQNNYVGFSGSGINPQYPFLDNDVIRAAFSVPAHDRGDPHEYKVILQRALTGVIPSEVLGRRTKGFYDEAFAQALRHSEATFRELVNESELAQQGIVKIKNVQRDIDRLATAPMLSYWALGRFVVAEGWLRSRKTDATHPKRQATGENLHLQLPDRSLAKKSIAAESQPVQNVRRRSNIGIPAHVRAKSSENGGLVVFNMKTNTLHPLTKVQSVFLRVLSRTGDTEEAITVLKVSYPYVDPETIEADLEDFINDAHELGIVRTGKKNSKRELPTTRGTIHFTSTEEAMSRRSDFAKPLLKNRVLATGALAVGGVILGHLAPQARAPLLRFVQKVWANRDATYKEAQRHLNASQGLLHLGRLACLEGAYTAALTLAIARRKVEYHQGVSFDPLAFHAWISVHGQPVRTEREGRVTGSYQSFYE